jgi:multidrug efflux pump subunit AcrB
MAQTADQKVTELILKLFKATFFVFVLVLVAFRALKPAIVVMLVIPVVLFMTIFVAFIWGITIDRVSLFALIFSIGILVDDAIVVVENIYRRWLEEGAPTTRPRWMRCARWATPPSWPPSPSSRPCCPWASSAA